MSVTNAVSAADPSIHFKGDGNDDVGDYVIEVTAKDAFNNTSKFTIHVSVMSLFTPPVFIGTGYQSYDFPDYPGSTSGYHQIYLTTYDAANVQPNTVKFKDYLNKNMPYLTGVENDSPTTNATYGVFFAGGDHNNPSSGATNVLTIKPGIKYNDKFCATDGAVQTVCQNVVFEGV